MPITEHPVQPVQPRSARAPSRLHAFSSRALAGTAALALFSFVAAMPLSANSRVGLILLVCITLVLCLAQPRRMLSLLNPLDHAPMLAAGALASWYLVLAVNWHASAPAMDALRLLLSCALLLLVRRLRISSDTLWLACCVAAIILGAQSAWQALVQGLPRAQGVYFHNIVGALGAIFGLLPWLARPSHWQRGWRRSLLWLGLVGGIVAALFSSSRMAWITIVVLLLASLRREQRVRGIVLGGVLLALVTGFSSVVQDRWQSLFNDLALYHNGDVVTSMGMRFEMWRASVESILARPWLGVGPDGFVALMRTGVEQGRWPAAMAQHTHAHNEFLHAWVTGGLPSMLGLMALLYYSWRASRRLEAAHPAQAAAARGARAIILLLVLLGLSETTLIYGGIFNLYLVCLLLCLGWAGRDR